LDLPYLYDPAIIIVASRIPKCLRFYLLVRKFTNAVKLFWHNCTRYTQVMRTPKTAIRYVLL
jgi:hypothetical protein